MPSVIRTIANNMLTTDEPDHTRLRSIVDEAFRRRAVLDMEPHIRAIADGLADELFAEGSPADLVQRYARHIAALGDLRTARPAAGRPAEIHRMGQFHVASHQCIQLSAADRRALQDAPLSAGTPAGLRANRAARD